MSALSRLLGPLDVDTETWPFPTDHLSATQLSMFQRCPEQYRRRYVAGQKERPGAAMVWGSADHYAHEQNFRQKIESHTDISEADVKLAFAEGFDQAVERNGGAAEVQWGDDDPDALKDKGVELVAAYHRLVSPSVQPVAVERKFSVDLPGVPVPIVGFVDVVTREAKLERKTAKQKQSSVKPEWRLQGLTYMMADPEPTPVHWHVSVKTKTPAVYTPSEAALVLHWNQRTVDAGKVLVQNLTRAMLAYWQMFGPHSPWPGAITHPWACDFCGFRPGCAWWER